MIKGYKVFNPDWKCRGFQFEVGKTYKHEGNIEMCGNGFHFCQKASDCFNYYGFDSNNKVAEVEAIGLVETNGDKSVTNEIKIIREIPWQEVLTIVNEGRDNVGYKNVGSWNVGDKNVGNENVGDENVGDKNVGSWNVGSWNAGDGNVGRRNVGSWNVGSWNVGDKNVGDKNVGRRNVGSWNVGNENVGYGNVGRRNVGSWNVGDGNVGFFSTINPKCTMFEKPTNLTYDEIKNLKGMQILSRNYANNCWIYSENMSEEEKQQHPEYETTGGYLKTVDFKTACKMMWDKITDDEKQEVMRLPNFDKEIFYKITGIKID